IGIAALAFFIINQIIDVLRLKEIYQIEYDVEPLAVPSILFRTIVGYSVQDWRFLSRTYRSRSLNYSKLSMTMLKPDISAVFVPKAHNYLKRIYENRSITNEINIKITLNFYSHRLITTRKILIFKLMYFLSAILIYLIQQSMVNHLIWQQSIPGFVLP
ncbi:hypothetical protein BDF19DRAFT_451561, partial [Syncephalis fuscata]